MRARQKDDDGECVNLYQHPCDDYGFWYWMCDDCGTTWGCDGESQLTWTSGGGRPCSCLNENGGIDTAYQTDTGWVNKECQMAHPD